MPVGRKSSAAGEEPEEKFVGWEGLPRAVVSQMWRVIMGFFDKLKKAFSGSIKLDETFFEAME